MSLSLEELRQRVVAIPGDLILCPECQEPLARFLGPALHLAQVELLPASRLKKGRQPGRHTLWCRSCGSGAERHAEAPKQCRGVEDTVGPRILVRSGSWTGWRALGGE